MRKGRGKGKISNDLVAASCVAVLAVYAAGYSRTREASRRFETQVKERRAAARAERPAGHPRSAVYAASAPSAPSAPSPAPAPTAAPRPAAPVVARRQAPRKAAASLAAATPAASGGPQEIAPVPLPAQDPTVPAPIAITREPTPAAVGRWRDGTYTGLGDSPHGDIEARVVIAGGRIVEAGIATCDTRYPCSVIDPLIHQPVERQSPDVDYMSHATESSDAYYEALVAALENAQSSSEAPLPK